MAYYLGIDTSNYTTSASLYDSSTNRMLMQKKLLPVPKGAVGLRQSDAVFHHTVQLPLIYEQLMETAPADIQIAAVGVSERPRDAEGSYMPCFLVGKGAGEMLSRTLGVPLYRFSHQSGHIAAALYSADQLSLMEKPFLAFHVSGGTTEAVLVEKDSQRVFSVQLVGKTLDLNAGQLIDRVGLMLGLDFPCGMALEKLAAANSHTIKGVRPTVKGSDCCLSGVENICQKALQSGSSKEYIAALCLAYIEKTIDAMCHQLLEQYGAMPILFAGGVMSDQLIRQSLEQKYEAYFAQPQYSSDNASGTALLCSLCHKNS